MGLKWNSGLVPHYPFGNGSEEASMIGTRLRRLRLARALTQRELAEPKYTHAYVSTIEAGRRNPSREALEHFAGKLGVDVDELLTGKPADLEARLDARLMQSRIDLSAGRLDEADEALDSIAREAKRYHLSRIEAKAEDGRGLLKERRGMPEQALDHYQRAEEIVRSGPASARADAVSGKARCFQALGDVRYAIHMLETLLDTLQREQIRDPEALTRLYSSLLDAYLDAGLYERAAASAVELDRLAPKLADPLRVAQMHLNVAHQYLEHALAIFEETGDEKDLTRTLNELARIERLEGRTDRARELLERSISIMGDSDTPILAWAHRELGLALTDSEPDGAEKNFRLAIELFERSEQAVEIAVTYRALGDLLHTRGEGEASCEAYRTGILALEPRL